MAGTIRFREVHRRKGSDEAVSRLGHNTTATRGSIKMRKQITSNELEVRSLLGAWVKKRMEEVGTRDSPRRIWEGQSTRRSTAT